MNLIILKIYCKQQFTIHNDYKREDIMANKQKATKNFKLSIKGILYVDENKNLIVSIEDRGEFDLVTMLSEFLGRECSISVTYDEDYTTPEVDEETGEII